jgi:hypothetical protein
MNGKSTLCKVVRRVLGDGPRGYALVSKAKIVSAAYDKHDTVFAALEKKRFAEIPEIDRSLALGARFKELTGNDSISARGMRQDERPIALRCKLGICANNNIKFDATAKSNRQRIETIPFRNEVLKPDPGLADKLLAEGPAILADIIEQARRYLGGEGLPACAAIAEATKVYADAACATASLAVLADDQKPTNSRDQNPLSSQDRFVPRLNDMMVATQLRHFKLWYAGVVQNWPLANYELAQICDVITDTERLYADKGGSKMSTMMTPPTDGLKSLTYSNGKQKLRERTRL